jgi:lipopolysaccharide biosynthesis glycosyltransferase
MYDVYIGYDSREKIAYDVCKYSLTSRNNDVNVIPLIQSELRDQNIYWRDIDTKASTEFTFTRFLVPYLSNYKGWVVFCDCDFLWIENIEDLFKFADDKYAVMVVQHFYNPKVAIKMDNQIQYLYPRKNWSSMILWNCNHPSNKKLDLDTVNNESGQFLHQFKWLDDSEIGHIPVDWNWLSDWYLIGKDGKPKAIHYTQGGPYFTDYYDGILSDIWKDEYKRMSGREFLITDCVDYDQ